MAKEFHPVIECTWLDIMSDYSKNYNKKGKNPVDIFPHTTHTEYCCLLERTSSVENKGGLSTLAIVISIEPLEYIKKDDI